VLLPLFEASSGMRHRSVSPIAPPTQLTANADSYAAGQGRALVVSPAKGVLVNDRDPQGKSLIAILVSNPTHGSLTFRPDGSFTYTNDGTGATQDSFSYQVSNGSAMSNIANVTITIGAPDAITTALDLYSLAHGGSITVAAPGVLANDIDPNSLTMTAAAIAPPLHGSLSFNSNGGFTYAHDGSNSTSDSFAYRATDGTLTSASTNAILSIGPDAPPTVGSQSYATMANTPLTVAAPGVLTGATDPDSPTITAVLQNTAAHGSVTLNPNGSFSYTPATGYSGADSFTYGGSDGILMSPNAGTASIAVSATPRPSAVDDHYVATTSALTINAPGILGNDSLISGALRSFGVNGTDQSGIGHPAVTSRNGQITLNADGSFVYAAPSLTFTGDDTFKYVIGNAAGTATALVTVTVAPINTNCPGMTIGPAALPAGAAGSPYAAVSFSQTGGTAPIGWASGTLPAGMTFSNAGVLSGTPVSLGTFNVSIAATDANGCVAISTIALNIGCPSIAIGATNLAAGTAGAAYPSITLSAAGGVAPIVWSVTSGVLPAGMSLSATGVLAGTPSQIGLFNFTVKATDANGCYGAQNLSLAVNPRCPAITISPTTLPGGAAGLVYPAVSFSQSGGALPVTWSSGALPPGMSFSSAGVLSGTPTSIGVFNVAVTATDANSCVATSSLPLGVNISCPTIAVSAANLAAATVGAAYPAVTLVESGGIGPFTWSVSSGMLPAGMSLSSAGLLFGTPAQTGFFPFTVKATDANACFGTQLLSLTVNAKCPTIAITPTTLSGGVAGVVYPATSFAQSGGAAPVVWSSGTLPPGLTLSNAGVLSGTPTAIGAFNVTVTATDTNSCNATLTLPLGINITCPTVAVNATNLPAATNGVAYPSVNLTETGGVAPFTWSLSSGFLPAGMTLSPAGVLSGTPTQTASFFFTVKVTDANGCFATQTTSLTVNSKCPSINIAPTTLTSGTPGVVYPATSFSQNGGAAPVTWSSGALPAGMSFSTAGVLSGTPTSTGVFNITVTATDANGCTATVTLPLGISVVCPAMAITSPTLAAATAGVAYPSVTMSETGGVAPIIWSVVLGTLPTGMTLSSNGILSGTPTQTGSFSFTVKVTDTNGCFGTLALSLSVSSACPVMTITTTTLTGGSLGVIYPATSFSQSGGTAPVTWSAGSLPPGMTFSTGGVLSGTPTVAGNFNITITATDANACTGTLVVLLSISGTCPAITISAPALPTAAAGVVYPSVTLSASGGIAPLAWSIAFGTLPTGMALSTGGVLSGIPTQSGSFSFTVKATDANGCFDTKALSFTVSPACPTMTITPAILTDASLGVIYPAVSFSQSGGAGPVTWSAGSLPSGMGFSTGGVFSGTPTAAGDFNITVTATDANGCTAAAVVPFKVKSTCPTITISAPTLTAATAGVAYPSVTFSASGGVAPIVWSITFGTLPTGMTLSSGGVLSGTPGQTGAFHFTVKATDASGCGKTANLTLTVHSICSDIVISGTPPHAKLGDLYAEFSFSQSGGKLPVTWSQSTPPKGMTLSTAGVLSGTPLVTGTFSLPLQVTDANGCVGTASAKLIVGCPTIVITPSLTVAPSTLPPVLVGSLYGPITFSNTGGVAPFVWSIASGTLPTGLTFSSGGTLSGTATVTGSKTLTFKVTDAAGCTGTATFSLDATCPAVIVNNPTVTTGTVGTPFNQSFTESGGPPGSATFAAGSALPPGLTFTSNSTSGVLSGTPTVPGTFPIVVTITDGNCAGTNNGSYRLVIGCNSISVSSNPALNGAYLISNFFENTTVTGSGYGFTATGANGTTTFSASGLPYGLSLQSNGILTGTVYGEPGTYYVTVQVVDGNGCSGSTVYAMVVNVI
jgi:hypothetical protein